MAPGPMHVTVHIDRCLGLSTTKSLPDGATIAVLKDLLVQDDLFGDLRREDLTLSPSGQGPLSDSQTLTSEMAELELRSQEDSRSDSSARAEEEPRRKLRLWAVSDVHSDLKDNMNWVRKIVARTDAFSEDCLLVAGDVANRLEVIRDTLAAFKKAFRHVFFIPGNHDVWCTKDVKDSVQKLRDVMKACDELGVLTRPTELHCGAPSGKPILVVPMLSWHHQAFDTEPELEKGWSGIPHVEDCFSDYKMCRWPGRLSMSNDSVAEFFDEENDALWAGTPLEGGVMENRGRYEAIISFSHFLPRIELCPEKRFLSMPPLLKAVGSTFLGRRVERLRPDVHIFGHTHFGWDAEHDGVRYLQAPLSYPTERKTRAFSIAVGDWNPLVGGEDGAPEPFLVWRAGGANGEPCGFIPKQRGGGWSEFYNYYGRRPGQVKFLPNYVASQFKWTRGGELPIGWCGQAPAPAFVEEESLLADFSKHVDDQLQKADMKEVGGDFLSVSITELSGRLQRAAMNEAPSHRVWVFDVRPAAEFQAGHIPGAISLTSTRVLAMCMMEPVSRRIAVLERITDPQALKVVLDSTGKEQSGEAIKYLRRLASAYSTKFMKLRGGFTAWRQAGLEVATGADMLPAVELS